MIEMFQPPPPPPIRVLFFLAVFGATVFFGGCASTHSGPYTTQSESARDPLEAQRLTMQAAAIMDTDPAQAQQLLNQALSADLYHGPAHNNLGVVYLNEGKLYEAAAEFEWARKLMPGHPDPRMNLALTLEKAGRFDDALKTYETALEVYPEHIPTLQAVASLQLRTNRTDEETQTLLQEIAFRGETPHWRQWAQKQLGSLRDGTVR